MAHLEPLLELCVLWIKKSESMWRLRSITYCHPQRVKGGIYKQLIRKPWQCQHVMRVQDYSRTKYSTDVSGTFLKKSTTKALYSRCFQWHLKIEAQFIIFIIITMHIINAGTFLSAVFFLKLLQYIFSWFPVVSPVHWLYIYCFKSHLFDIFIGKYLTWNAGGVFMYFPNH